MSKTPISSLELEKPSLLQYQEISPDFTPSVTGKSSTPAPQIIKKAKETSVGSTPQKLLGVSDKAFAVREVHFSRPVRLPGYPGASNLARTTGDEAGLGTYQVKVKSLVIVEGTHTKLIVDGDYFMSFASGAIDGWKY
jgi:hypothetical protein